MQTDIIHTSLLIFQIHPMYLRTVTIVFHLYNFLSTFHTVINCSISTLHRWCIDRWYTKGASKNNQNSSSCGTSSSNKKPTNSALHNNRNNNNINNNNNNNNNNKTANDKVCKQKQKTTTEIKQPQNTNGNTVSKKQLGLEDVPGPFNVPFFGSSWLYTRMFGRYTHEKYHEASDDKYHRYGPVVREKVLFTTIVHLFAKEDINKVLHYR